VEKQDGFLGALATGAEEFIAVFNEGGKVLLSLMGGILPTGRFLPERFKPAFYDSAVSFVHPILGIFPHANPGELFVYVGIATGIQQLGYGLGDLAVRYLLVGLVVIFIRGIVTEIITARMMKKGA